MSLYLVFKHYFVNKKKMSSSFEQKFSIMCSKNFTDFMESYEQITESEKFR